MSNCTRPPAVMRLQSHRNLFFLKTKILQEGTSAMFSVAEIAQRSQSTSNIIHNDNAPIKGIRARSGTATTPSISFEQDNDTGLFNPSSNTLGIVAGSNNVLLATPSNILTRQQLVVSSNIMPADNAVQMIGSSNMHFKEAWIDTIHISQNTLYLGDTPVLGTESDSVAIRADLDQSINVKTTGLGVTNLTSTKGVNVAVSGLNSVVDVQSSGAGGRVVMGAATEVALNAPTTTVGSNLTVQGNLTVNGTQFTANVQTVEIKDNILVLNKGQVGSGVSAGYAGFRVDRGDAVDYDIVFNETTDKFEMGAVGSLLPIATEAYALPKTGGTLTGALTGTSASFDTLGGGAITSAVNSTASNVAASAAALKVTYDGLGAATSTAVSASNVAFAASNTANLALPKSGGTMTGTLNAQDISVSENSTLQFQPLPYSGVLGRRISLWKANNTPDASLQYYGFGISHNTLDYMVQANTGIHKFSCATSDTSSNAMFEIREAYARSYGKILCEDGGTWAAPTIALKGALNHDTGMCMLPGYGSNIGADRQLSFSVDGNVRVFIHGDNDYNGNANILQIGIQGAANTNGNIIRTGNNFLQFQATTATGPISQYVISGSSTGNSYSHLWRNRSGTDVMKITRDEACLAMGAGSSPSMTSYTWMGNGDTGMYSPATDVIGFSTSGVARMVISTSNVQTNTNLDITGKVSLATPVVDKLLVGSNVGISGVVSMITAVGRSGTCFPIGTHMNSTATTNQIVFNNPNGTVGSIQTINSQTNYNTSSDYRIKENIVSMNSVESMDKVSTLNPVTFTFKSDPSTAVSGFIAHEVKEVYPDCVGGDKDAIDDEGNMIIQSMDYGRITPLLCSALKGVIDNTKELSSKFLTLQSQFQEYVAAHP